MNKRNLVDYIAAAAAISKNEAKEGLESIIFSIQKALKSGENVQIVGFGGFEVAERPARKGNNPQTGESIIIPARKVVTFKPGKALRDAVDQVE